MYDEQDISDRLRGCLTCSAPPPPPASTQVTYHCLCLYESFLTDDLWVQHKAPPIAPAWPGSRLVNVSRMMPNVSFPEGGLSGDPTVKSIQDCQTMCDQLPACQTWTAFTITTGRDNG